MKSPTLMRKKFNVYTFNKILCRYYKMPWWVVICCVFVRLKLTVYFCLIRVQKAQHIIYSEKVIFWFHYDTFCKPCNNNKNQSSSNSSKRLRPFLSIQLRFSCIVYYQLLSSLSFSTKRKKFVEKSFQPKICRISQCIMRISVFSLCIVKFHVTVKKFEKSICGRRRWRKDGKGMSSMKICLKSSLFFWFL